MDIVNWTYDSQQPINMDVVNWTSSSASASNIAKIEYPPNTSCTDIGTSDCNSTEDATNDVLAVFPSGTMIISFTGSAQNFEAKVRFASRTKEDFLTQWLKEYQNLNKVTFRVGCTKPKVGKSVVYKAVYRCQHKTGYTSHKRVKKAHIKNTDCPAALRVTIKSTPQNRRVQSKDELRFDYPTLITVEHNHNHEIDSPEALRHRDLSDETKTRLIDLFQSNHPPAIAMSILREELQEEYGEEYETISNDASICPDRQTIYQLYYSLLRNEFDGKKLSAEEFCKVITERGVTDSKMKCKILNENEFAVAAIPVLMQRVHNLDQSRRIVFIESCQDVERLNCRVFLLLTDSAVGSLPLGFVMTSSGTEDLITCGFKLFQEILSPNGFGGNGSRGPDVFVSDGHHASANALKSVFPLSLVYQCIFHVLQSTWRWLLSNGVDINDVQYIFKLFKLTITSVTETEFHHNWSEMLSDVVVNKYENLVLYLNNLLKSSKLWVEDTNVNMNTKHVLDAAMKIFRENVLNLTNIYNPVQMYKFLEREISGNYTRRICDIITARYNGHHRLRRFTHKKRRDELTVLHYGEGLYTVVAKSGNKKFIVNTDIESCSCMRGLNGSPCRHQHVVYVALNKARNNISLFTPESRAYYHFLAYGTDLTDDWYADQMPSKNQAYQEDESEAEDMNCDVENDAIDGEFTENVEEANSSHLESWSSLEERLNLLLTNWKKNVSTDRLIAFDKAVTFLESCNKCDSLSTLEFLEEY